MKLSVSCKNLLTAVLTVLLSLGYVSSTMCWHSHVIGGQVIVHSHIFWNGHTSSGTDGGHTQGQLQTIQEANDLTFTDSVIPEFHLERVEVLTDIFFTPAVCAQQKPALRTRSLRAPPVLPC